MFYIGRDGAVDSRGTYQGIVYESTGPWLGEASFDPAKVTRKSVGGIVVKFIDNQHATAKIWINDGVEIQKSLVPFAMRMNDLSGAYEGHIVHVTPGSTSGGVSIPAALTITDN